MTHQTFAVTDPRNLDGNPYDVASSGVAQLSGILAIARDLLPATVIMVRNAEMERRMHRGEDPAAGNWDETAEGQRWKIVETQIAELVGRLAVLQKVAAYDPRNND
jgi:hypothetical protein